MQVALIYISYSIIPFSWKVLKTDLSTKCSFQRGWDMALSLREDLVCEFVLGTPGRSKQSLENFGRTWSHPQPCVKTLIMSHIHSCSLHSLVSSQAIKTHCLVARGLSVSNRGERQIKVQELSPLLDGAFAPVAASHTCEAQEDFGCLAHKLPSALLTPWVLVGKLSFNLHMATTNCTAGGHV